MSRYSSYIIVISLIFLIEFGYASSNEEDLLIQSHATMTLDSKINLQNDYTPIRLFDFMNKSMLLVFMFFKSNISDIDDHTCPMHPTCSQFGLGSLRKDNYFIGTLKTLDRLHRCNHDLKFYSISMDSKRLAYSDRP